MEVSHCSSLRKRVAEIFFEEQKLDKKTYKKIYKQINRENREIDQAIISSEIATLRQARESLRNNGLRRLNCTYSGVNICQGKSENLNVFVQRSIGKMHQDETASNTNQAQHFSNFEQEIILESPREAEQKIEMSSYASNQVNRATELEVTDESKINIYKVVASGSIKEIKKLITILYNRKQNGESVENEQIVFLETLKKKADREKCDPSNTQHEYQKVYETARIFLNG